MSITFLESEEKNTIGHNDDALIITVDVSNYQVARILIDNGSSVGIIFISTLKKMNIDESTIEMESTDMTGFNRSMTPTMGTIKNVRPEGINKLVVLDCSSPYNMILGRPEYMT